MRLLIVSLLLCHSLSHPLPLSILSPFLSLHRLFALPVCICDEDSRKQTSAIFRVRSLAYIMYAVVLMMVVGMGLGRGQDERRKL